MNHLERPHLLPCVVCLHMGTRQQSRTVAHHLESVRDEDSDYAAVALCNDCHKQLHRVSRRGFERMTKLTEIDLLGLTIKAMETRGLLK